MSLNQLFLLQTSLACLFLLPYVHFLPLSDLTAWLCIRLATLPHSLCWCVTQCSHPSVFAPHGLPRCVSVCERECPQWCSRFLPALQSDIGDFSGLHTLSHNTQHFGISQSAPSSTGMKRPHIVVGVGFVACLLAWLCSLALWRQKTITNNIIRKVQYIILYKTQLICQVSCNSLLACWHIVFIFCCIL